mmetsp:Transcript_6173/g.13688  ORF Transcript_6173/g.13688 Transcript_6173/m.13688 type:complete len:80 (+) Transcript_6173:297-536(+)
MKRRIKSLRGENHWIRTIHGIFTIEIHGGNLGGSLHFRLWSKATLFQTDSSPTFLAGEQGLPVIIISSSVDNRPEASWL